MLAVLGPTAIVSSDLIRARRTAEALAAATGLPVAIDPGLRETFADRWQGMLRPELERDHGPELLAWSRGEDIRPGGGGETRSEVAERMLGAIDRALLSVGPGGTLAVVTHGGAARSAVCAMLGLPRPTWGAFGVFSNCSWAVLTETGWPQPHPAWRLTEYNAGSLPVPALGDDR